MPVEVEGGESGWREFKIESPEEISPSLGLLLKNLII